MSSDPGTWQWFVTTPVYGAYGVLDYVLRMFDQRSISRAKCRELIQWIVANDVPFRVKMPARELPAAPWTEVFWEVAG